ncbi:uncharacterized protein B0I36DRAFT_368155 [Microdochium trichocladiopsis]|uniref:Uncharacterized protein n=1 Tax=Microdochium trichocladiopsis TaxID=1682393 RepID=A0A9P9BJF9_9PEZI|nr:uncharacterized protein B0I36DRAFT_368155 [Microdochium trichocladiopsis]KAH7018108.1 hypothetical protein B0I36DRAFT_368155 [Microdochium trichocladiopsis]
MDVAASSGWPQPRSFEDSDVLLLQQEQNLQQQLEQQTNLGSPGPQGPPSTLTAQDTQQGTPGDPPPAKVRRNGTAHLSAIERLRARTLYFDGRRTKREIVSLTGYSLSQVRTAIKQPVPKKRPGRPRKDGTNVLNTSTTATAAPALTSGPARRRGPVAPWEAVQTMTTPMAMAQQALSHGASHVSATNKDEESSDDLESDNDDDLDVDLDGQSALDETAPNNEHSSARPLEYLTKTQPLEQDPLLRIHASDPTKTIVLVTNASTGIGHAIASALCLAYCPSVTARPPSGGPYHVLLADRDFVQASDAARTLTCHHSNTVSPLQLDTRDPQSVISAARFIHEAVGRIDVLVLNNSDHGQNEHRSQAQPNDLVSILRDMLETNLVSSYAVSEGLKWLLMAQPALRTTATSTTPSAATAAVLAPAQLHKVKRLIHVTSPLSSIAVQQSQTRFALHHHSHMTNENGSSGITNYSAPMAGGNHTDAPPPTPAMAEYRMSLAALNMLAACQASAAQAAGVRVGVWNSGLLPPPPMPAEFARADPRQSIGDMVPAATEASGAANRTERSQKRRRWRRQNAGGPGIDQEQVLAAGRAFVRVVNGERDAEFGGFMDTYEGFLPW